MAKRSKLLQIEIDFRTFDFKTYCLIGDRTAALRWIEKLYESPGLAQRHINEPVRGQYFSQPGYVPVIWLPKPPRTPTEIAALSHEMLHTVLHMLVRWAGMRVHPDHCASADEPFCHALGYGVRTVLTACRRA
jgi:hypothetical protein